MGSSAYYCGWNLEFQDGPSQGFAYELFILQVLIFTRKQLLASLLSELNVWIDEYFISSLWVYCVFQLILCGDIFIISYPFSTFFPPLSYISVLLGVFWWHYQLLVDSTNSEQALDRISEIPHSFASLGWGWSDGFMKCWEFGLDANYLFIWFIYCG